MKSSLKHHQSRTCLAADSIRSWASIWLGVPVNGSPLLLAGVGKSQLRKRYHLFVPFYLRRQPCCTHGACRVLSPRSFSMDVVSVSAVWCPGWSSETRPPGRRFGVPRYGSVLTKVQTVTPQRFPNMELECWGHSLASGILEGLFLCNSLGPAGGKSGSAAGAPGGGRPLG